MRFQDNRRFVRRCSADHAMKNPWTKKNPFMSLWLSAANRAIAPARGQAAAAVKRETRKATTAATTQVFDAWANALKPPSASRRRRKTR